MTPALRYLYLYLPSLPRGDLVGGSCDLVASMVTSKVSGGMSGMAPALRYLYL